MAADKVVALRRTYRGEEQWFGLLEFGHSTLRDALIRVGVSPQIAGNLVWFLEDQARLERHQSEASRVRYRRALAGLDVDQVRKAATALAIGGQFKSGMAA